MGKIIEVKNIAVSDNQNLNMDILQEIIEKNLDEFIYIAKRIESIR